MAVAALLLVLLSLPVWSQHRQSAFQSILGDLQSNDLLAGAMTTDSSGFLWIATWKGLMRYDGSICRIYENRAGNPASVSGTEVNTVFRDSRNQLWVGTKSGLSRYNSLQDEFENFLQGIFITTLAEDAQGYLWVGTYGDGLLIGNTDSISDSAWLHFRHRPDDSHSLCDNVIASIVFDHSGRGWIGTGSGLELVDPCIPSKAKFRHARHDPDNPYSPAQDSYLQLHLDQEGNLWIISTQTMLDVIPAKYVQRGEVHCRHLLSNLVAAFDHEFSSSNSFFRDRGGDCWFGTVEDGLFQFRLDSALNPLPVEQFVHEPMNDRSLSHTAIWSFYEDAHENLFVGTQAGVSKWLRWQREFSTLYRGTGTFQQSRTNVIAGCSDNQGNTWFASDTDSLLVITSDGRKKGFSLNASQSSFRHNPNVLCMAGTDLFAGTASGLCRIPAAELESFTRNEKPYAKPQYLDVFPDSFTNRSVGSLLYDPSGFLWVGSGSGLCRIRLSTLETEWIRIMKSSSEAMVRCLVRDEQKVIWFGTDNGLFSYHSTDGALHSFYHQEKQTGSLPDNGIYCLAILPGGLLWIGTKEGLCEFNSTTRSFSPVNLPGLQAGTQVYSLLADSTGPVWLGTADGLVQLIPAEKKAVHYNEWDGLASSRMNRNAAWLHPAGVMCFGSEGGLISFLPEKVPVNRQQPLLQFTDFKLFETSILEPGYYVLKTQFLESGPLHLHHSQNFFTIRFAALDFTNPSSNQYRYQLVGVDPEWVEAGSRNAASYTGIRPGRYSFRVQGAGHHGAWNNEIKTLFIDIAPPWYQSWWFYALLVLALTGLLVSFYRYRINQLKKIYVIRSKIARDLHDDIGSTLSSISLMSQMASGPTGSAASEKELFETISSASREAMDLMSDIVWSVNPNNDKIGNIVIRMREYAGNILEAAGIRMNLLLSGENVQEVQVPMVKRKDFYLIFKESVNNLAKYAHATEATITLQKKPNGNLSLTISDNGSGFDPGLIHSGNGLRNMNHRAANIGAKLQVETALGRGTVISLELPVNN